MSHGRQPSEGRADTLSQTCAGLPTRRPDGCLLVKESGNKANSLAYMLQLLLSQNFLSTKTKHHASINSSKIFTVISSSLSRRVWVLDRFLVSRELLRDFTGRVFHLSFINLAVRMLRAGLRRAWFGTHLKEGPEMLHTRRGSLWRASRWAPIMVPSLSFNATPEVLSPLVANDQVWIRLCPFFQLWQYDELLVNANMWKFSERPKQ